MTNTTIFILSLIITIVIGVIGALLLNWLLSFMPDTPTDDKPI